MAGCWLFWLWRRGPASPFYNLQARDLLKVTRVAGDDAESQLEGSRRDQQVFESDRHALRRLISFNAPREPGCLNGDRMDGQVTNQLIHKCLAPLAARLIFGALYTMRQFNN